MRAGILLSICLAGAASAAVLEQRAQCNDNCGRAIIATRPGAVSEAIRSADCMRAIVSVFTTTVTPKTTSTATITLSSTVTSLEAVVTVTTEVRDLPPRKRALSTSVPVYASACTKPGQYESACSCLLGTSISTSTSTVTVTAATSSITDTATTTKLTTTLTTTTSTSTAVSFSNAPPVVLPSPTAIAGDVNGGSTSSYDDPYFLVTLPFPITIYGQSDNKVYVSVNGVVFIQKPGGQAPPYPLAPDDYEIYSNKPLPVFCPQQQYPTGICPSALPPLAVAPFWDDLYIYPNTPQGLYYQVFGSAPARTVVFEWYTSHYQAPAEYYHFTAQFSEDPAASIVFKYYQISDSGGSATVGLQGQTAAEYAQYSSGQTVVTNGLELKYDPAMNAITQV